MRVPAQLSRGCHSGIFTHFRIVGAIARAVADWILMDGHNVSVVEGEGFAHTIKLF